MVFRRGDSLRQIVLGALFSAIIVASSALSEGQSPVQRGTANASSKAFLCYWGTWAHYRREWGNEDKTDPMFDLTNIDVDMCTHLIYSFVGLNKWTSEIGSLDPYLDYAATESEQMENGDILFGSLNLMAEAIKLKDQNPDLKVLVAIGGWGQGSKRFSDMAANDRSRGIFISSVVRFLELRKFDGLDMDWEYPGMRDGDPEKDKDNFVLLLKELREAFTAANPNWELTAALGAGPATVEVAYNVSGISEYLDFLNIMAYDLKVYVEGEWEQIGHHSPLYPKESEDESNRNLSVSACVQNYLDLGAPPERVALGVGAYGKSYTMVDPTQYNYYDKVAGSGHAFGFSQEPGTVFYNEICRYIAQSEGMSGYQFGFDYEYYVPFAHNGTTWIGFDDEYSVMEKVDYAHEKNLGGMMIWSIDQDDFNNWCGGWTRNPIGGTVRRRLDYHANKDADL